MFISTSVLFQPKKNERTENVKQGISVATMTTPFLKKAFLQQLTPMEHESYAFASVYLKDAFSLTKSNAYVRWFQTQQEVSAIRIQQWWKQICSKR